MTDIDTATGLPTLPEDDLFFRVTAREVELRRSLPDGEWSPIYPGGDLFSRGSETFEVDSKDEILSREVTIKRFMRKPITRTYKESDTLYRKVNRSQWISDACALPEGEEPQTAGWGTIINALLITRENVVEVAENALNKYLSRKANEVIQGDYPPKSL